VVFDVVSGVGSVGPGFGSDLRFDRGEEGFCGGAVEAGAGTACGLSYLEALQEPLVFGIPSRNIARLCRCA
jgi:hypothetical protein